MATLHSTPQHLYCVYPQIALVIRMQLNQLNSSDPLADDFYAQVYNARKGLNSSGGTSAATTLLLQYYNIYDTATATFFLRLLITCIPVLLVIVLLIVLLL
jgi:hypothetical protein